MLLFCVHTDARFRDALDDVDTWSVSVLADDQGHTADWLASPGRPAIDQLARVPHRPAPGLGRRVGRRGRGVVRLPDGVGAPRRRPRRRRRIRARRGAGVGRRRRPGAPARTAAPGPLRVRPDLPRACSSTIRDAAEACAGPTARSRVRTPSQVAARTCGSARARRLRADALCACGAAGEQDEQRHRPRRARTAQRRWGADACPDRCERSVLRPGLACVGRCGCADARRRAEPVLPTRASPPRTTRSLATRGRRRGGRGRGGRGSAGPRPSSTTPVSRRLTTWLPTTLAMASRRVTTWLPTTLAMASRRVTTWLLTTLVVTRRRQTRPPAR